jgi:nucleotide-binding universal stress UspA family protein
MSAVIAAVDNSAAARAVVETAAAVARLSGAALRVLHVREDGLETARAAALAAGVALEAVDGAPPEEAVARTVRPREVEAVVVGARRVRGGRAPAGHIALSLLTRIPKPVFVVPPDARPRRSIGAILVPLDGTPESAQTVARVIDLARESRVRVVVLHVHTPESLPGFEDQSQHEREAYAREFVARHCRCSLDDVEVELRVGRPGREVVEVAQSSDVDLIALGWRRNLAPGRAATVKEALTTSSVPILLVPLEDDSIAFSDGGPIRT